MTQYPAPPPDETVLGTTQQQQQQQQQQQHQQQKQLQLKEQPQQQQRGKRLTFVIIILLLCVLLVGRQFATPHLVARALKDTSASSVLSSSLFFNNSMHSTSTNFTTTTTTNSLTTTISNSEKDLPPTATPIQVSDALPSESQSGKEKLPDTLPEEENKKSQDEDESTKDQLEEDKQDNLLQLKDSEQQQGHDAMTETTTSLSSRQPSVTRPPTLLSLYEPISRALDGEDNTKQKEAIEHLWSKPKLIHYYIRKAPSSANTNASDLFIYTTGVNMGNFNVRKLNIYGCVVPPFIFPLSDYFTHNMDVFLCHLPFTPTQQINISLAIIKDESFLTALQSPLPQPLNSILEYNSDVFNIPSNYKLYANYINEKLPSNEVTSIKHLVHISSDTVINQKHNSVDLFEKGNEYNVPRYEICGVTMMKQFPHLMPDWMDYHRRIGVDMFYIFDNDSDENMKSTYMNRSDVDVIYWPYQRSQVQAMSYIAVASRARCEWLISFDADEYILLPLGLPNEKNEVHPYKDKRPLKLFLSEMRRKDYDDVRFKYITMGPSGNTYIPKIPPPEAYICKWFRQKLNVKSASLTDRNWLVSKVHYQKGAFHPRSKLIKGKVDDRPTDFNFSNFARGPALVHFQFRSLEESMLKKKFGSSSIGDKNPSVASADNKETRSLSNPSKEYREIIPSLQYTFFRDVWRNVTAAIPNVETLGRTLVVWRDNHSKRCVVQWMGDDESGHVNDVVGEQCTVEGNQSIGKELSKKTVKTG